MGPIGNMAVRIYDVGRGGGVGGAEKRSRFARHPHVSQEKRGRVFVSFGSPSSYDLGETSTRVAGTRLGELARVAQTYSRLRTREFWRAFALE